MSENNNSTEQSLMPQPTLMDIYNLLTKCAQKNDIDEIKASISEANTEINVKIEHVQSRIDICNAKTDENTNKISALEVSVELLKQDQLKNNMCISGVPPNSVTNGSTSNVVIAIAKALGLDFNASMFTSYPVAANKFIIVHFYNMKHKQWMMNKIRVKKSLMVEEVLNHSSNSQIYLNDHLTPYFNALYLSARKAKNDNKLASASSYGGKIRVRKQLSDVPTVITSAAQLRMLIDADDTNNMSQMTINSSDMSTDNAPGTSRSNTQGKHTGKNRNSKASAHNSNHKNTHDGKQHKRKLNTSTNDNSKANNSNDERSTKKARGTSTRTK